MLSMKSLMIIMLMRMTKKENVRKLSGQSVPKNALHDIP